MIPESVCEDMRERGARVISLTLLGSRRFGFPTPSSDSDYVGIYQWPLDDYLGFQQGKTSYELSLDVETQVKWYELRAFLKHIEAGKPDMFRCLYAAPCYSDPILWPEIASKAAAWYNPRSEWESAAAWTRKFRKTFAEGGTVSIKDFCHWTYRALAVKYVERRDYFHHPLISITDLAMGTGLEEAVRVLAENRAAGVKKPQADSFGPFEALANEVCREGQVFRVPSELVGWPRNNLVDLFKNSLRKV